MGCACPTAAEPVDIVPTYADKYFSMPPNDRDFLKLVQRDENGHFKLKLAKKDAISHDVFRLTFEFPDKNWQFNPYAGAHLGLIATDKDGNPVRRMYTQVSELNHPGELVLVTKVYRPNEKFPEGGKMGAVLDKLEVGEYMKFMGPVGPIKYTGSGGFQKNSKDKGQTEVIKTKLGFLAGGSGITPCFSVIQASVLSQETAITEMVLIYSNKTEDDILLREELDNLQEQSDVLKVYHTLTRENEEVKGTMRGRVTRDLMIKLKLPEPSDETLIWICGPKEFHFAMTKILKQLEYTPDMVNGWAELPPQQK